jgi:hypothetical protein
MSNRDPLVDPLPGDVVKVPWGNPGDDVWETRTVEDPLLPNGLQWHSDTHHGICMFSTWRRWAKRGVVVKQQAWELRA